jgi:hypothetical protein
MATKVYVIGANELAEDFERMRRLVDNSPQLVTEQLADSMTKFAHVITGYLKASVYHKHREAGANAPYAGYESDRGGDHDFAERAIEDFDINRIADKIVEPF